MDVVYERCCGLDIHKKTVVACAITPEGKELRTFGTMTGNLLKIADWLKGLGVTHVARAAVAVGHSILFLPTISLGMAQRTTIWGLTTSTSEISKRQFVEL